MNRIPFGVVGAAFALDLISSNLTGRYAGVAAVFEPDDRTKKRLEPLLMQKGIHIFNDYKKFLVCGVRAVLISSGTDRAGYAVKALRSRLDVLCEPPIAMNSDELTRLERAVRDSGKSFVMAEYACHRREVLLAGKLYRRGDIGQLISADSSELIETGGIPVNLLSTGSIGKALTSTRLTVNDAVCLESSARGISIGTELMTLSGGAHLRAWNGNFGIIPTLRLIGESGIIEASRGRVLLTDCTSIAEKSTSIRPEGFMLPGMISGAEFARSSAIAGFAAKLLGDSEAAGRCIDFARAGQIVSKVVEKVGKPTADREPFGYNIERK